MTASFGSSAGRISPHPDALGQGNRIWKAQRVGAPCAGAPKASEARKALVRSRSVHVIEPTKPNCDRPARLVETLSTHPEAGPVFQNKVLMFPVAGYVFLYEHDPDANEIHVLDMIALGQNWR